MERLAAADAWFLYLENPCVHLHVTGVVLLGPTASGPLRPAAFRRHLQARLPRLTGFRRRLVEVPLGIDHPVWIDDPDFDIRNHVVTHRLGPHATDDDLARYVGEVASVPLDRSRPLWQMILVTGLSGGRTALVAKIHHCMVDGITGVAIMGHLFDVDPDAGPDALPPGADVEVVDDWVPEALPSPARAAADAAASRLGDPARPLGAISRTVGSLAQMGATAIGRRVGGAESLARPLDAPRTLLNAALTPRREVAIGRTPLARVKAIKDHFGVTVNDVVLAAVTSGLRDYLVERHGLPDAPLVCSVPVSVHGGDARSSNQVSNMFVHLPTQIADPVERLRVIHRSAAGAKEMQRSVGADLLGDVVDLLPPRLFELSARLYTDARLADRLPPVHNVVVSNVAGSPMPLYVSGAPILGLYPFGPLMEGAALNVSVLSTEGQIDVGLIACPDVVDDLAGLRDGILAGVDQLAAAAGLSAD